MDRIVKNLTSVIKDTSKDAQKRGPEILNIIESWPYDSKEAQIDKFARIFKEVKKSNLDYDLDELKSNLESHSDLSMDDVNSILEIGNGPNNSLVALAEEYQLPKDVVFTTSVNTTMKSITRINLSDLEDDSIDLIILYLSLHHIHPKDRVNLTSELKRVISLNGMIIVKEYDYNKSTELNMSLDILDSYNCAVNSRKPEPSYFMSRDELVSLFESENMKALSHITDLQNKSRGQDKSKEKDNSMWTRSYWTVFELVNKEEKISMPYYPKSADITIKKLQLKVARSEAPKELMKFTRDTTRMLETDIELPYDKRRAAYGHVAVGWGQLKLFIMALQLLVEYWVPSQAGVRDLTVLYVGSAPGTNILLLSMLFPTIKWILYDPDEHTEDLFDNDKIEIHTGDEGWFTYKLADEYAEKYTVKGKKLCFISDVRTRNLDVIRETQGEKAADEEEFKEMIMQKKWFETINPYIGQLKNKFPYPPEDIKEKGELTYLAGDIIYQPFISPSSIETRLVPRPRRNKEGKDEYYEVTYDTREYESKCSYHNAVVREIVKYINPVGNYDVQKEDRKGGLDNHYDSTFFLFVLGEYFKFLEKYKDYLKMPSIISEYMDDDMRELKLSKYVRDFLNKKHQPVDLIKKRQIRLHNMQLL